MHSDDRTAGRRRLILRGLGTLLLAAGCLLPGEDIRFPSDAGILDVTAAPYGAIPDDDGDDTAAIQAALDAHPNGNRIIYLPNGVYRISDTLRWSGEGGNAHKRTILQGQSQAGTILRLPDAAAGFGDPGAAKAMIWTGSSPAQRFRNAIRNLTVHTGSGNPGATGIRFIANNTGCLRSVTIISGDGQGVVGLDMGYTDEIGPLLIQGLTVDGFDRGIRSFWQVNSQTAEDVTLRNQKVYGWHNYHQPVFIRRLVSHNAVPALYNQLDSSGCITLVDSTLTGVEAGSARAAVWNQKALYVRDLTSSGYPLVIDNDDKGRDVGDVTSTPVLEHSSHTGWQTLWDDTPQRTLRLPVPDLPEVAWDDPAGWDGPHRHASGGVSARLQAAIDSGATTIYLPNGLWELDGEVIIRGAVRRIIGCEARVGGTGTIRLGEGSAPVVIWERIDLAYGSDLRFEHASSRTWRISSSSIGVYSNTGDGDLYLDDVVGGPFTCTGQRVWARQLNQETDTQAAGLPAKIVNDAGQVWIFGLKTERPGTILQTINGGRSEVLGAMIYATGGAKTDPAFVTVDATLSVAGLAERSFAGTPYQVWGRETRGGVTRSIPVGTTWHGSFRYTAATADAFSQGPRIDADPVVDPDPVTGTSATGSVLASDPDGDDALLTYQWAALSTPAGAGMPAFAPNDHHSASTTTIIFDRSGQYTLQVTVTDGDGLSASAQVTLSVHQTNSSLSVRP